MIVHQTIPNPNTDVKKVNVTNSHPIELPKYAHFCNITGNVYNEVTVLNYAGVHLSPKGQRTSMWVCRCSCGMCFTASGNNLKRGNTKTCGCSRGSHKMSDSPEWEAWASIIQRCTNPKNPGFKNYGGRGIAVCERWRRFENFFADMGVRPKGYSIDRTNNEGNYESSNCKWVLNKFQHRNKRTNRMVTLKGQTRCLSEWAEIIGVSVNGLAKRLAKNWAEEDLFAPPMRREDWVALRKNKDLDPESGLSHIAHAAACCDIILDTAACGKLNDDRSKKPA